MEHVRTWLVLYALTLMSAVGCYIYLQQALMHRTYRLHEISQQHARIARDIASLQEELALYRQPSFIRAHAHKKGLRTPTASQYVTIPDDA